MADAYTLEISGREHVGALGVTQSGKTTALLRFLNQIRERGVIVIDTKQNVRIPNYKITTDPAQAIKIASRGGKVIYRPKGTKPHPNFWMDIWGVFGGPRKPNVTVFVDEAGHVTSASNIDEGLALLLQAGRQNGIGVWWAAQQSTRVNNTLLSQSEKLLVFKIIVESDRKKIANAVGKAALDAHKLESADPARGLGGEFMAFGFPEVEPVEAGGKVDGTWLRAV